MVVSYVLRCSTFFHKHRDYFAYIVNESRHMTRKGNQIFSYVFKRTNSPFQEDWFRLRISISSQRETGKRLCPQIFVLYSFFREKRSDSLTGAEPRPLALYKGRGCSQKKNTRNSSCYRFRGRVVRNPTRIFF